MTCSDKLLFADVFHLGEYVILSQGYRYVDLLTIFGMDMLGEPGRIDSLDILEIIALYADHDPLIAGDNGSEGMNDIHYQRHHQQSQGKPVGFRLYGC